MDGDIAGTLFDERPSGPQGAGASHRPAPIVQAARSNRPGPRPTHNQLGRLCVVLGPLGPSELAVAAMRDYRPGAAYGGPVGPLGPSWGRLVAGWWSPGQALTVVDGDTVPSYRVLDELAACDRSWCWCPADDGTPDRWWAPAAVRFSRKLTKNYPRLPADLFVCSYYKRARIANAHTMRHLGAALGRHRQEPHRHGPPAIRLHRLNPPWPAVRARRPPPE